METVEVSCHQERSGLAEGNPQRIYSALGNAVLCEGSVILITPNLLHPTFPADSNAQKQSFALLLERKLKQEAVSPDQQKLGGVEEMTDPKLHRAPM